MKKEIEVFLTEQDFNDMKKERMFCVSPVDTKYKKYKALLILDVPEKKITISEKEFDEACSRVYNGNHDKYLLNTFDEIKQKLFSGVVE